MRSCVSATLIDYENRLALPSSTCWRHSIFSKFKNCSWLVHLGGPGPSIEGKKLRVSSTRFCFPTKPMAWWQSLILMHHQAPLCTIFCAVSDVLYLLSACITGKVCSCSLSLEILSYIVVSKQVLLSIFKLCLIWFSMLIFCHSECASGFWYCLFCSGSYCKHSCFALTR